MRFAGYAAVFDRVDRAGDVMRAGAFAGAGTVPLLWQHRGRPVGTIEVLGEDARGLRVSGTIAEPRLAALVRGGAVAGLSVGYRPRTVRQGARRELMSLELVEVSLVAVPMQPLARVDQVG
ncbi:HK97 family phage prohead protease [Sphingomonas sp. GC_Shp_1]|uniref:HK97 family phage prohead protease n=1 Tax=unclassified Sphingomonas TaxID=196159 RepID=UPI00226A01BA